MQTVTTTAKGASTRESIIDRAYRIVRTDGFEGLSIGTVASSVGMSKSGVFAHFGSREDLQLAVLDASAQRFTETVFVPALRERRGLTRLLAIMRRTLAWMATEKGGCPILSAAMEYDDHPGAIRDRVIQYQTRLRSELARAVRMAVDSGELASDTDADQLAFDFFAIELAVHHDARLFGVEGAMAHAERSLGRLIGACKA